MKGQKKSAEEMRNSLGLEGGIEKINNLFDSGTFTELNAYVKRRPGAFENDTDIPEGVRTGFGALDGELAFTFVQDMSRNKGAFTSASAKKIADIMLKAEEQCAPVVGIFDSLGVSIKEGPEALSGYSRILAVREHIRGKSLTVAIIDGTVTGLNAAVAASFDITIKTGKSFFAVTPASLQGDTVKEQNVDFNVKDLPEAMKLVKDIVSKIVYTPDTDADLNKTLTDISVKANGYIEPEKFALAISDEGEIIEYRKDESEIFCGFIVFNSTATAVLGVGTSEKRKLTSKGIKKASDFIKICSDFDLQLLNLVSCEGLSGCGCKNFAKNIASLSANLFAHRSPMVTLITGAAYGAAFALFASKKAGNDVVYALPEAEISALSPKATVEFLSDNSAKDLSAEDKEKLIKSWTDKAASPLFAAQCGEIDDIIDLTQGRQRISAAFEMLM